MGSHRIKQKSFKYIHSTKPQSRSRYKPKWCRMMYETEERKKLWLDCQMWPSTSLYGLTTLNAFCMPSVTAFAYMIPNNWDLYIIHCVLMQVKWLCGFECCLSFNEIKDREIKHTWVWKNKYPERTHAIKMYEPQAAGRVFEVLTWYVCWNNRSVLLNRFRFRTRILRCISSGNPMLNPT